MILSADIGGTKTNVALFEIQGKELRSAGMETYHSREHTGLEEILGKFLARRDGAISRACFGVAGPVKDGRSQTTNLAWVVDSSNLARMLGLCRVGLLNDMEATAWAIGGLVPKDLAVINPGRADPQGNGAVIAAGTGLGEAGLEWNGKERWPFASEGGHSDFAPRNELELELLRYLAGKFGHVSYERVLSGPGLHNIYNFLRDTKRAEEPAWLAEALAGGDPSAVIARVALERRAAICERALDLFVEIYGAETGNLALKMMATAGVYLGGGIAPKIAERLKGKDFLEAFVSKGRMRPLLEDVPVNVILHDSAALLGAARWALRQGPEGWRVRPRRQRVRNGPARRRAGRQ
jgi:glucokinase